MSKVVAAGAASVVVAVLAVDTWVPAVDVKVSVAAAGVDIVPRHAPRSTRPLGRLYF